MRPDDLLARHRAVLPSWMTLYYDEPMEFVSGSGRRVTASDGRTYLDLFAGVLTTGVGYDIPEISDAIRSQLGSGVLHSSTLYLIRKQVELAERIAALSGIPDAKVFFTCSGTEANETALLLATEYRRSSQVLAMRNSYHGRSFGAVGISGNRGWSPTANSPVQVHYVHGGYRYRSPFRHFSDGDYVQACVEDLVEVLDTATSGDVACLIAEPIQGIGGFAVPPDGLFGAFAKELSSRGILLIADEVQTGWGRTGEHFWGIQAHGVTPDAMTFAKGLGNGLTIGGVVARAELMDVVQGNSFSTFGGNPVSTAGAVATLEYLLDHDLQANCAARGAELLAGLRALDLPIVGDVRGKGLLVGVELVGPAGEPDPTAVARALEIGRAHGILIGKGGLYGNVLRISPPMTITAEETAEGLAALTATLRTLQEELTPAP